MRWFRVILCFYMSVLSWWPCADRHPERYNADITAIQPLDHVHEHGLCSPFCACGCCGVIVGLHYDWGSLYKPIDFPSLTDDVITYAFPIPDSILDAIWQPPKFIV